MDNKTGQCLAEASKLISSVINDAGGINDRLGEIECWLDFCFDRLDFINENFRVAWLSVCIKRIMEDLRMVGVLIRKVTVLVSLQATLKEIHEIDAEFDK